MLLRKLFFTLVVLSVCAGCAPVNQNLTLPVRGVALEEPEREALFAALDQVAQKLHTLKGLARVVTVDDGRRTQLRYAFLYNAPSDLRVEVLPLNGAGTLGLLVARSSGATYLDPQNHEVYQSENVSQLLGRLLHLNMNQEELAALLSARISASALQRLKAAHSKAYIDREHGSLTIECAEPRDVFILDERSLLLKELSLEDKFGGSIALRASYHFSPSSLAAAATINGEGRGVPETVKLQLPQADLIFDLNYSTLKLNVEIPERLFDVAAPSDYVVKNIH